MYGSLNHLRRIYYIIITGKQNHRRIQCCQNRAKFSELILFIRIYIYGSPNHFPAGLMIVIQESKATAQSWWDRIVAFNNEWMLGTRLKILVFGASKLFCSLLSHCTLLLFSPLSHFIATFSLRCIILLLILRHWLIWDGRHHGLGEREKPDHQRRYNMGRNNGVPPIPPHDHPPALGCIWSPR